MLQSLAITFGTGKSHFCEALGQLAIDTAAKWIRFGPERAKDSGAVQAALEALVAVMAERIAVLIVHHHRKGAPD